MIFGLLDPTVCFGRAGTHPMGLTRRPGATSPWRWGPGRDLQVVGRWEVQQFFKLPGLVKLTNTEPFAAWIVVIRDATADET